MAMICASFMDQNQGLKKQLPEDPFGNACAVTHACCGSIGRDLESGRKGYALEPFRSLCNFKSLTTPGISGNLCAWRQCKTALGCICGLENALLFC
jgi:hypothetical protein